MASSKHPSEFRVTRQFFTVCFTTVLGVLILGDMVLGQACSDRVWGWGFGVQGAMALALFLRIDFKNTPDFDYC